MPARIIEYYIEIASDTGDTVREPSSGAIRPHTFHVGSSVTVGCTDLEANPSGFTHSLLAGTVSEGADDWQWGTPRGQGGDPGFAYSGSQAWGNDLGGTGFNGEYQADKHNQLITPNINLSHYEGTFLTYRRWLTVEDGYYDRAVIKADGQEIWDNFATNQNTGDLHHIDDAWAYHVVPLGSAADDGRVQISWDIISDGGLEFGGWNLDDLCVKAPATADNRLGITTFRTRIRNRTPEFFFKAPRHGPVEEVRVVRTNGAFPTGPNDGDIVLSELNPSPGQTITGSDPAVTSPNGVHYAVYAFDGTDWLSWTVDGWNASAL